MDPLVEKDVWCPASRGLAVHQRISLCCSASARSGIRREGDRRFGGRLEIPISPIVKPLTGIATYEWVALWESATGSISLG